MKKLHCLGASMLAIAAASVPASAADACRAEAGSYKDAPVCIPSTWTGFYIGVNGGYGWNENKQFVTRDYGDLNFGGLGREGGFGGGQIGYNWQGLLGNSALVLGIEYDIQGAGISDSAIVSADSSYKSELEWFGTVRGRVGYAGFDQTLLYFTGGFAYGSVHSNVVLATTPFKFDETVTGYVLGGGIEYKFNPAWSMKVEYQYLNFGKQDPKDEIARPLTQFRTAVNDDTFHTVRVGVNYHVGLSYEPLK